MTVPRSTRWPGVTAVVTGSYVVRMPFAWAIETTPRPATGPAKTTTPSPGASMGAFVGAARSTPRWPGPYGVDGGWNGRTTGCGGVNGQVKRTGLARGRLGGGMPDTWSGVW